MTTGSHILREVIEADQDIGKALTDLCDSFRTQTSADYFAGALATLLECYAVIQRQGVLPRFQNAAEDEFLHSSTARINAAIYSGLDARDPVALQRLSCIAGLVTLHRKKIQFRTVEPLAQATEPATEAPKALPLEIVIVGMPDRTMTQQVYRDKNDEIVSTTTNEVDSPK
jgi:hypothetical protein